MRNPVTTYKRKFDGSAKPPWYGDLVEAGEDGWLAVFYEQPPHTVSEGTPVAYALRYFHPALPLSVLASFDARGSLLEYQCDAGLPATIDGRRIDFVDLDLDLMVTADGMHHERDHDTFARNRAAMAYTPGVVAAAYEGLALAGDLLRRKEPPFDGSATRLLGRVIAAQGPL